MSEFIVNYNIFNDFQKIHVFVAFVVFLGGEHSFYPLVMHAVTSNTAAEQ